jgi:nucleoid-associated protein YgaU
MKKLLTVFAITGLVIALQGCSSAETGDDGLGADDAPAADAGTDAVPPVAVENPDGKTTPDSTEPKADAAPPPMDQAAATPPAALDSQPPVANNDSTPPSNPTPDAPAIADTTPPAPAAAPAPAPAAAAAAAAPADQGGGKESASNDSSGGGGESYTVQSGDTLMKIAFEKYGDLYKWKQIYEANRDQIKDPNRIYPGLTLKLSHPADISDNRHGEKYLVKNGDTLGTISNDVYGTPKKWKKLWKNNKEFVPDPNKIFAGFYVYYVKEAGDAAPADQPNAAPGDAPAVNQAPMADGQAPAAPAPTDQTPPTAQNNNPPTTSITEPVQPMQMPPAQPAVANAGTPGQPGAQPGMPPAGAPQPDQQRMPASQ